MKRTAIPVIVIAFVGAVSAQMLGLAQTTDALIAKSAAALGRVSVRPLQSIDNLNPSIYR